MAKKLIGESYKPSESGGLGGVFKKLMDGHIERVNLKVDLELQKLKNELESHKATENIPWIDYFNKIVEFQRNNTAAKMDEARLALFNRCIEKVDKLKAKSLQYIILSFVDSSTVSELKDKEVNDELEDIEVKSRNEDLKQKKVETNLKKDKWDKIKKENERRKNL